MSDPTTPSSAATPAIPRGTRRAWLLSALAFLASTALPWSCRGSPIQWTAHWASVPTPGDRALALHAVIPLLMLVAIASRETAPRVWPRMSVATLGFFGMASLAVVSFGDTLPARPQQSPQAFYRDIPRVILAYEGWTRHALRALLFVPPALSAGWALAGRGTDRAPLANRLLLGFVCVGLTLAWGPARTAFGWWVSLAGALSVLLLAPFVPDEPAALEAPARRRLALASGLWFVALAALALTRARRV
jgi:hypothetical protein